MFLCIFFVVPFEAYYCVSKICSFKTSIKKCEESDTLAIDWLHQICCCSCRHYPLTTVCIVLERVELHYMTEEWINDQKEAHALHTIMNITSSKTQLVIINGHSYIRSKMATERWKSLQTKKQKWGRPGNEASSFTVQVYTLTVHFTWAFHSLATENEI